MALRRNRSLNIPIFCILLFIYCIIIGVPKEFFMWLSLAILGDLVFNPIIREEEMEGEDE